MNTLSCPRCGEHKLEYLNSHSFCWECGYSPENEPRPISRVAPITKLIAKALTEQEQEPEQALERAS